ncbi:MAG: tRNA 2-thiouridine(34) synthase MnmA, partial [Pseudomonadota bacterium]
MAKIVVGLSGGVDSAVAAALLKEQGHEVIALFMKNWEEKDGPCPAEEDYKDVVAVCEQLDIPYYAVEFIKEYQEQVFSHFLKEYEMGYTPNPDILCNREIKFKVFWEKAKALGGEFLATGHYAQNPQVGGEYTLHKGVDPGKDQSYFLYTLDKNILKNVLFPVGGLLKKEVREIAARWNLPNKDKKDSTGICFIGERNFRQFLAQFIKPKKGPF